MSNEIEYDQDDRTVLVDYQGHGPAQAPLTEHAASPRIEQLGDRMIFAARLRSADTFDISLNTLVAAASDLLSEVVQLKHSKAQEELGTLNTRLANEVDRFEARALHKGAESSHVNTARYLLCTVVDEAVVTAAEGNESHWPQMSLLSRFHSETFGGEKFFQLLSKLTKDPVKHLPMLELMYLCMALGFEGKYRIMPHGNRELEGIRDSLYRQIRQLRGDVPRELSPHWQGLRDKRRRLVRIVPWWMVALFTGVCLVVMYSGFAWVLGEQRDSVLHLYQQPDPSVVQLQQQFRNVQ
ncbi:type IVB secretion system protein IcmH/DotU [Pseudomonas sp. H9]|uniref:type IVB secretion system protein IcmH/DotU n=1 Tax=Pseudomonas sp. H9 TaxID=483968 RepID=UPI0010576516|nr:type IVB secretion system protein IcmH/DotU [Pseudomonas sp. H9]TDF82460.1 DotU family type IV/VI secretion system protein [Pseudomonas sp. H9]